MTETPSTWAQAIVAEKISLGLFECAPVADAAFYAAARALDAARAEGEAKGRREALEEAAGVADERSEYHRDREAANLGENAEHGATWHAGAASGCSFAASHIRALIDKGEQPMTDNAAIRRYVLGKLSNARSNTYAISNSLRLRFNLTGVRRHELPTARVRREINRMVEDGLVTMDGWSSQRNDAYWRLTDAGRAQAEELAP